MTNGFSFKRGGQWFVGALAVCCLGLAGLASAGTQTVFQETFDQLTGTTSVTTSGAFYPTLSALTPVGAFDQPGWQYGYDNAIGSNKESFINTTPAVTTGYYLHRTGITNGGYIYLNNTISPSIDVDAVQSICTEFDYRGNTVGTQANEFAWVTLGNHVPVAVGTGTLAGASHVYRVAADQRQGNVSLIAGLVGTGGAGDAQSTAITGGSLITVGTVYHLKGTFTKTSASTTNVDLLVTKVSDGSTLFDSGTVSVAEALTSAAGDSPIDTIQIETGAFSAVDVDNIKISTVTGDVSEVQSWRSY